MGNIHGRSHPAYWLLYSIRPMKVRTRRIDPAGGDGIDTDLSCEADSQRMGQRRDSSLGRGVAFGLGLAQTVPGGGKIDDAGSFGKVRRKELAQIKRRSDARIQRFLELFPGTLTDPAHLGRRVVHKDIHTAKCFGH